MRSMLRHDSSRKNVGWLATARPDHPGSVEPATAGLVKPPGSESTSEVSMEPSMCRTGVDLSKYPRNAVTPERRTFHGDRSGIPGLRNLHSWPRSSTTQPDRQGPEMEQSANLLACVRPHAVSTWQRQGERQSLEPRREETSLVPLNREPRPRETEHPESGEARVTCKDMRSSTLDEQVSMRTHATIWKNKDNVHRITKVPVGYTDDPRYQRVLLSRAQEAERAASLGGSGKCDQLINKTWNLDQGARPAQGVGQKPTEDPSIFDDYAPEGLPEPLMPTRASECKGGASSAMLGSAIYEHCTQAD